MVGFCDFAKPESTRHTKFSEFMGTTGIHGMCVYDYNNTSYGNQFRTDSLSGVAGLRREKACRIMQKIG